MAMLAILAACHKYFLLVVIKFCSVLLFCESTLRASPFHMTRAAVGRCSFRAVSRYITEDYRPYNSNNNLRRPPIAVPTFPRESACDSRTRQRCFPPSSTRQMMIRQPCAKIWEIRRKDFTSYHTLAR